MKLSMNNYKFEVLLQNESKKLFNYLLNSYKSYLFRTAYHKALNLIKKRNAKNKLVTNYNEMEHFEDKQPKNNEQQNELVKDALSQLKPEEALLMELQFYQKMNYKQIAETLETTQSAVDSKLVRAKKKLIKIINEQKKMQENNLSIV